MKTLVEHALCKAAQNDYEPLVALLNKVNDLSRAVDIAHRFFKIPRNVAAKTIRRVYLESKYR